MSLKAFTLAEILITLAIIGVVSSITMPVLISNIETINLKSAWKKAYSEISSAYASLVQDNGGSLKGVYNLSTFSNAFKSKLNYTKYCPVGSAADCIPNLNDYYLLNGTKNVTGGCGIALIIHPQNINTWAVIKLANGSTVFIFHWVRNCDASDAYISNACNLTWTSIAVDVNGESKPNVLGKDLNIIMTYANTIKPAGISENMEPYTTSYSYCSYKNSCKADGPGFGCAAKFLFEN